ncbi:hypothetical protein [Scytonema sp. NUACC26]|uniref:hypothetical protein n=1 Tax=Scytonema sp. NUACC26 TaxID=3140176 RepID=UPI0038B3FA0D
MSNRIAFNSQFIRIEVLSVAISTSDMIKASAGDRPELTNCVLIILSLFSHLSTF